MSSMAPLSSRALASITSTVNAIASSQTCVEDAFDPSSLSSYCDVVSIVQANYAVNEEKALGKKQTAANLNIDLYAIKATGGGAVITCQSVFSSYCAMPLMPII